MVSIVLPAFAVPLAVLVAGCSPALNVGLSNAPRLGAETSTGGKPSDAISNGGESCGRYAEQGPLRGKAPPCPASAHPSAAAIWVPMASENANSSSLVVPWLEHFYVGWPCTRPARPSEESKPIAWSSPPPTTCSSH